MFFLIGIIRLEAFGTHNLRHVTDNTEEDPLAGTHWLGNLPKIPHSLDDLRVNKSTNWFGKYDLGYSLWADRSTDRSSKIKENHLRSFKSIWIT